MKILLRILTITSFVSSCFAYNVETKKTFSLHLRNGGDKLEDNQEPAYAGYNFDVTHNDDDTVSILFGQPRSGELNLTVSPGSLYYCNFEYLSEMKGADIVTRSPTTESATSTSTSMTTSVDNDNSMETTTRSKGLVTTVMPKLSTPNCTKLKLFDWTNPNHRDLNHQNAADALGLSLARIANSTDYAACTPLRQRKCPNSVSYTPGGCYVGNPKKRKYWTFKKWEETRCFNYIIEIIFVVDGSGTIGYTNFKKVRDWLINCTVELFEEFGETVRTEVLQYSNKDRSRDRVSIEDSTKFEIPYTLNEVLTIDTITDRIKHMKYLNSQTYTYYALRRTMEVEFPRSDFYETSKKIIIVLTDGAANDKAFLPQWYEKYKDTVTTFAIGVGDFTNFMGDLKNIANGGTSSERVSTVEDFESLQQVIANITSEIKSTTSTESSTIGVVTTAQDKGSIQIGMSIASSKNGGLYLGAVGSYEESGIVIKYDGINDITPDMPTHSQIQDALPNRTTDSYMGYATVIGYFDGMTSDYYVATGAPRHMLFGAVVVYKPVRNDSTLESRVTIMLSSSKRQVAEYYGGSLLALDVSGDGKDDLFVGAPLNIGNKYDEGRVLVYISQDSNTIQTWANSSYSPIELYGRLTAGRFGTAIANAGDINLDGYNDVVIGAPLADDSRGAVYIYHGKKGGIKTNFGQEIRASEFTDATPKYFGHFLQGNIDIDKNGYPDIFVGAPRTDSVIILRSRPVVKIYVSMNFTPSNNSNTTTSSNNSDTTTPCIDLDECITKKQFKNCLFVNICFTANGTSMESEIDMRYNISLDTAKTNLDKKRVEFFIEKGINLTVDETQCFSYWINMKKHINDYETIIAAEWEFDLLDSHKAKLLSPVRDPSETNKKSTGICIDKKCEHKICRSDLHFDVTPDNVTIVVNSFETSVAKVNMSNNGEKAFQTAINVTYTSQSKLRRRSAYPASSSCIVEDGTPIDIGHGLKTQIFRYNTESNIMMPNSWCHFEFYLIIDPEETLDSITLNITAYTNSSSCREIYWPDNSIYMFINLIYERGYSLKSEISGADVSMTYLFEFKNLTSSVHQIGNSTNDVKMNFTITGTGYSNIPISDIVLTWPAMSASGNPLLYLYKIHCHYRGPSTKNDPTCTCNDSMVNPFNLPVHDAPGNETSNSTIVSLTNIHLGVSDIDCTPDDSQNNSICENLKCTVINLGASDKVDFVAFFRLWTPSLKDPIYTRVHLKSGFKVSTSRSPFSIFKDGSNTSIKIEEVTTTVRKYVIIVAEVGEFTLIIIVVLGGGGGGGGVVVILKKRKFFDSKLEAMKKETQDAVAEVTHENITA